MFFHIKLRKTKIKTSQNADPDVNADADAEISKWPLINIQFAIPSYFPFPVSPFDIFDIKTALRMSLRNEKK